MEKMNMQCTQVWLKCHFSSAVKFAFFKELLMKYTTTIQVSIFNYILKLFFQLYQNILENTKTHSN